MAISDNLKPIPKVKLVLTHVFLLSILLLLNQPLLSISLNKTPVQQELAFLSSQTDNPKLTVSFKNDPIEAALQEIAQKAEIGISYKKQNLPRKLITYEAKNTPIFEVLKGIFKGTRLYATLSKNREVIIIKKAEPLQTKFQTGSITGTVTNKNGEPVPTANVLLVEIGRGTATNLDGEYSIENVPTGTYTLRVSFVGYKEYRDQVTIEDGEELVKNVILQKGAVGLEELIVTGFGRESKVEFSGSAAQVDIDQAIKNVPVVDVTGALQGSVSGLQIGSSSGTPGTKKNINIRGVSSINAGGSPLIVVDGIPVSTGDFESSGDVIDNNSDVVSRMGLMATLNPQSIESITVLKGPVATAQYGARGSNGVIVITTKRGTAGETRYSVSIQSGTVSGAIDGPQPLNAYQAAELYIEGRQNAGLPVSNDLPFWNGPNDDEPGVINTNWKDLVMRDKATTQTFALSASGGNDKATFYGSINYQKKENIIITSEFSRIGANLNFTYNFDEYIYITNQFSGTYSDQIGFREAGAYWGNPLYAAYYQPAFTPAYLPDGTPNLDPLTGYNSLFTVKHDKSNLRDYRILNSTQLNIDILDNLSFSSEVGIDYVVSEQELYQGPVHGGGQDVQGASSGIYTRQFIGTIQNSLKYIWDINADNALDIQFIQSAQLYDHYILSAKASGFGTRGLYNLASASIPKASYSANVGGSMLSFLGKVHYGFRDKIFVDATIRQEASSKFAKDSRWGTFYALGAAWLLSSEDFLAGTEWLDLLKLRTSYGITGNSAIGRNQYQAFLGYSVSYDNVAGAVPGQLGNRLLTWEKAQKTNIGLAFGLFNRIDGDLTFFYSNTYDLLYSVPRSRVTGFNSQLRNVGELVNKGIEFSLSVDVVKTQDFLLSMRGNITYLQNKITALPTDATGIPITIVDAGLRYVAVEGYPVNAWYMRTWAGVNPENGMPLWELNDGDGTPGEVTSNYADARPEYQGASGMPTHYGSIGLTVNYKGFYAGASLYGSFGALVYDSRGDGFMSDGADPLSASQGFVSQLKRWQKPGDITNVPKRIYQNTTRSNDNSSRYLYDGDYLRLQTVRLGYNVPVTFLSRLNIGIRSLNLFIVGNNMWTYRFDPDLVWDPETGDLGFVDFTGPPLKSITFGLNIQF